MSQTIYEGTLGATEIVHKITPPNLDIDAYFPVENPDNFWNMRSTRIRRNGEVLTDNFEWKIHGKIVSNGKPAWLLGDNNPMLLVISKDEDGIQHHADLQPKGRSESFSPPWTSLSNNAEFGQRKACPYILSESDGGQIPAYLNSQMTGYETISLPAGIFQNCVRVDTYYQRATGTIYNSVVHFAPGVGLVRYKFRQIDPSINSVVVVGTLELEHAMVNDVTYGAK